MGETTNMLQASVDLDGQVSVSVPLATLPALINALLRLCTHAQLGEVVVPRVAGEWMADDGWSERHVPNVGLVGRVWPGGDNEGPWVAWSWPVAVAPKVGHGVRTEHPTRADAEAAVDERLRADGVVLP